MFTLLPTVGHPGPPWGPLLQFGATCRDIWGKFGGILKASKASEASEASKASKASEASEASADSDYEEYGDDEILNFPNKNYDDFKTIEDMIMTKVGVKRYCCKRHLIGNINILEKL